MLVRTDSRNDVYLSLLAGKAVTGLADLADDPHDWNQHTADYLNSGIHFCALIRLPDNEVTRKDRDISPELAEFARLLKRVTSEYKGAEIQVSAQETDSVQAYLARLLKREVSANTPDLLQAMNFFIKATSGCTIKIRDEAGSLLE